VEAALRLKVLEYDRVVLPIGLSAPFPLARFGRRTVPGLVTDEGYRDAGRIGVKSFIAAPGCGNKRR
jgi:hypothetical protein